MAQRQFPWSMTFINGLAQDVQFDVLTQADLPGAIDAVSADVGNVGSTETTVVSFEIEANRLDADEKRVEYEILAVILAGSTALFRSKIEATTHGSNTFSAALDDNPVVASGWFMRTSSTTARWAIRADLANPQYAEVTGLDFTAAITLTWTAEGTADNQLVVKTADFR